LSPSFIALGGPQASGGGGMRYGLARVPAGRGNDRLYT